MRPSDNLEPVFLFYYVQTKYFVDIVSGQVRGMLYPAVTDSQIRNTYLPLPPLSEQKRIVARLQEQMREIDRARIACEKQLEAANALLTAYLREVFESKEAKKWERKKLGEMCEIVKGKKPELYDMKPDMDSLPYLTAEVIRCGVEPKWCLKSDKSSVKVNEDEIILIADGSNSGEVFTGYKGVLASTMGKLKIDEGKVVKDYLFFFIRMNFNVLNKPKRGSAIQHLEKDIFYNLYIPLPPIEDQHRIATELKDKMTQVENLKSKILNQQSTLEALPQAILKKAFRGEL